VSAVFASVAPLAGPASFERIERTLSAYRDAFVAGHGDACAATRLRGEQSEATLERRMECMEGGRRAFVALVRELETADERIVERAPEAALRLPAISDCSNPAFLTSLTRRAARGGQGAVDQRLADDLEVLETDIRLQRADRATPRLESIESRIDGSTLLPFRIRARLARAMLEVIEGRHEEGARAGEDAAALALEDDDPAALVDGWLLAMEGHARLARREEARRAGVQAAAGIKRLGGDVSRTLRALWLDGVSLGRFGQDLDAARAVLVRAERLAATVPADGSPWPAVIENELAINASHRGAFLEAARRMEHAIELRTRLLGPEHRRTWVARHNLAETYIELGRIDEGIALLERALATPSLGLFYLHDRLARGYRKKALPARALEEDLRGIAACDRLERATCSRLAHQGAGLDLLELGRPAEAVTMLDTAAGIDAPTMPAEQAELAFARARAVLATGGDRAKARAYAASARDLLRPSAERFGGPFRKDLDAIEAWLATTDGSRR
jgi:eukaryotic-like serine/threonine-protein kinase